MKKATQCVHEGTYHDPKTGGVNTPIFTSSSFEYVGRRNVPYPRYFNTPNQDAGLSFRLSFGLNSIIFVGNRKVVWGLGEKNLRLPDSASPLKTVGYLEKFYHRHIVDIPRIKFFI